jgi:hypothetical protein
MAYTVNYTDAATYWIVPRAQWNKGQQATVESMQTIMDWEIRTGIFSGKTVGSSTNLGFKQK